MPSLHLQPNTFVGTAKKITPWLSVGPELAGEARKTALGGTLLNHSLVHYCWNCVFTRQLLSTRSILQQPIRCTSTFSSLDVKCCSVCTYLSLVLLHLVLGIPTDIVVLDFRIYTACYSVCVSFHTSFTYSGWGTKQKGPEPRNVYTEIVAWVRLTRL